MTLIIILILLQIKHWYIDFVNQSDEEVKHKGIYGDWRGLKHSLKHGVATVAILFLFVDLDWALFLGGLDFLVHYHTDYCKMRFGNRDINTKAFWAQLGLDQLVHQLTYIFIIWVLMI